MPASPRKAAKPSAASQEATIDKAEVDASLPHLDQAAQLAELIATEPERLANGDAFISALSVNALKQIFDYSVQSEKQSIPSICAFIDAVAPSAELVEQRISRSAGKRKRGQNEPVPPPRFEGTPLEELVTDGMNSRQLWEQIDLKASKMSAVVERFFAQGLIREEEEDDDEGEEDGTEEASRKAGPSRSRLRDADDDSDLDEEDDSDMSDDDMDPEEERVRLSQLSDADLRALGVDPAYRDQFLAEMAENPGAYEEDESDEEGSAYAGASDISDGDPTEVFYEPLKTEAEQRQRKEEQEMAMLPRLRSQVGDDDDEDADADGDEVMNDEDDLAADSESEEEDGQPAASIKNRSGIPESLLEDLDRPGRSASRSSKRHPTLDDDFFSIDELNRQLDEQDAEEDAGPVGDDDDDDLTDQVDYFKPLSGAAGLDNEDDDDGAEQGSGLVDAGDAHYADFFLPPAKAVKFNKKFGKRKASARFADEDAEAEDHAGEGEEASDAEVHSSQSKRSVPAHEEPDRKRTIRFNDTIEYRRIKPRKKSLDDFTPEMLRTIGVSSEDVDAARRFDDDTDEAGEQSDEEDENMEMDEVESETSSVGRDDDGQAQYSDEDEDEEEQSRSEDAEEDNEDASGDDDGIETAQRVAGDLFADSDDEGDVQDKLSTHEKRVLALKEEIARLEDENVGKKEWTLMGEAGTRARPQDSLLEQDLEFERAAKVTPQVTEEMTESIEDLIKRRILDRNFDDVIRRREMEALPFLPSRLLELSDSKSSKSLAELYEEEYQAARGGDGEDGAPIAEADAKLAKEHEEITALYDDIFNKLDALSNAHFTPKAPKATIQTLTNAPSVSIESALPSTSSSSTMLAPEEVYERSRHSTAMEGAKSEMTPEEKQRLHNKLRQEKRQRNERIQDTRKALEMSGLVRAKKVNEKEEKQQALKKLVGNRGVSVVGKDPNALGAGTGKKNKGKGKSANGVNGTSGMAKPTSGNHFKL